jgi:uncharacterized protein (DUF2236 family)
VDARKVIEQAIADLEASVSDPRAGIHGPGSVSWEVDREGALFLAGGRAALLQLAHPFVATAVDEHSATRSDVAGRFRRTFEHVYAICFGALEDAFRSARRVHKIHTHIEGVLPETLGRYRAGDAYRALDPDALLWVHATLLDSALLSFQLVVRPLAPRERDRYVREANRFGRLFGIPAAMLPNDHAAFRSYFERMVRSDAIAVGSAGASLGRFLMTPPSLLHTPVTGWYAVMTTGLLPAHLRAPFGLAFGLRERALYRATLRALRTARRITPARLRYVPAYVEAHRRLRGEVPVDRIGRAIERAIVRVMATD